MPDDGFATKGGVTEFVGGVVVGGGGVGVAVNLRKFVVVGFVGTVFELISVVAVLEGIMAGAAFD